jgi:hypothetical protein
MLEIGEIAKATRDVVKQLTDVIGLIEKNLGPLTIGSNLDFAEDE